MRGTGTKMKSTKTHTSKQRQQGTKKPRLLPSTLKSYCTEQKSQVSRRSIKMNSCWCLPRSLSFDSALYYTRRASSRSRRILSRRRALSPHSDRWLKKDLANEQLEMCPANSSRSFFTARSLNRRQSTFFSASSSPTQFSSTRSSSCPCERHWAFKLQGRQLLQRLPNHPENS